MALLVFPALNEAPHVPRLAAFSLAALEARTVERALLLDGGSSDGTVKACHRHGLEVIEAGGLADPRPSAAGGIGGKGGALRRLLAADLSDLVVMLDADVVGLDGSAVETLLRPLSNPEIALVKGVCPRAGIDGTEMREGRVSALVARPALELIWPELQMLRDPLSGQVAFRSSAVNVRAIADGYGLEISMLLDVTERLGPAAIREVELGSIVHRHKDVNTLAPVARDVLSVILSRLRSSEYS